MYRHSNKSNKKHLHHFIIASSATSKLVFATLKLVSATITGSFDIATITGSFDIATCCTHIYIYNKYLFYSD